MKNEDNDELNYCYINGEKTEVSSGFKLFGSEGVCTSCPICYACLNLSFNESTFDFECKVYNPRPKDIALGYIYKCEAFKADKSSIDYEMVKKQMEDN